MLLTFHAVGYTVCRTQLQKTATQRASS